MKAALVTGATGFIGRALCAHLQEWGVGVRALARRETAGPWNEFVVTDLGDGTFAPLCWTASILFSTLPAKRIL